jgi:hypothetical protein
MSEIVKVERVVIGPDGEAYRAPAAKRWLDNQRAAGRDTKARYGIAKEAPPHPPTVGEGE